jgi:hypothetical protein
MKTQVWLEQIETRLLGDQQLTKVVATGLWPVHLRSASEFTTAHRAVATVNDCVLR